MPIPSLVICELLGVPYDDREDFQRAARDSSTCRIPIPERLELQRQGRAYMTTLVQRARQQPGEDILGMLVREHGDELTDDELIGIAGLLLLAGHETTSNMLGLGTLALLRHPEQLADGARRSRTPSGLRSRSCCAGCPSCRPRFPASPPPTSRSPA